MHTVLEVANVEKYYGNKESLTKALDKISFEVQEGEFVGIMGASGSGKTTLLNCISTIDRVTSGKIIVNDIDITRLRGSHLNRFRREDLGFIFQDFNLLDTLTAYENIALALSIRRVKPAKIACARAIITRPQLVLADEPTGALDSKSARMLLESFQFMNQELGATILMVTHDAFTASYADRILFIKDGKLFNELHRGEDSRREFFGRIIEVVTLLGGELNDVL